MLVDTKDLVTKAQIAQRCGVTPQTVSMWAARYPDFPNPVVVHGNGHHKLYSWAGMKEYLTTPRQTKRRKLPPLYKGQEPLV